MRVIHQQQVKYSLAQRDRRSPLPQKTNTGPCLSNTAVERGNMVRYTLVHNTGKLKQLTIQTIDTVVTYSALPVSIDKPHSVVQYATALKNMAVKNVRQGFTEILEIYR